MESYFLGVLLFAVGIALTIALHESGHFMAARAFGMKVRKFFIGFGPTVFSFKKGETEYGLKAIPLGGFCDIAGMTSQDELPPHEQGRAMYLRPWWQRVIVMLGGIMMNLVVCFVIIYGVSLTSGLPNLKTAALPIVGKVTCAAPEEYPNGKLAPCEGEGPAERAGIEPGDLITAVNGTPVTTFAQLSEQLATKAGETVPVTVDRHGQAKTVEIPVQEVTRLNTEKKPVQVGAIGVEKAPVEILHGGPIKSVSYSAQFMGEMFTESMKGLAAFPGKIPGVVASIFGAERDMAGPMSVVGASRAGGELVEKSLWEDFFMMLASLNLFLALFNLVPLPPLDGGHIAVVLYETLRNWIRKLRGLPAGPPVDYNKLMPLTFAVAAALMVVGALVIVADIVNPIRLFG